MGAVLEAFDAPSAPAVARAMLGWPFKWLGPQGRPELPPVTARADGAGARLHQVRPDPVDPAGRGGRRVLATQLQVLQDKLPPFPTRSRARHRGRAGAIRSTTLFSEFSDPSPRPPSRRSTRRASRGPGRRWRSRCCGRGSSGPSAPTSTPSTLIAWVIETLSPASRRLRPRDVIAHFEGVVMAELDLRLEVPPPGSSREHGRTMRASSCPR
jgi:ubiquinone biosynthesis protein